MKFFREKRPAKSGSKLTGRGQKNIRKLTEERRTVWYAVLLKQMRKNMGSECDLI